MTKKSSKIELKIVFDTNALHTVVAHDLLNSKTKRLIENNSNHKDIHINWYLPEIVILERQFQMLEAGRKLLPSIEKIEFLLAHKLNINDSILKNRVEDCIKTQIAELKITEQKLDTSKVDWQSVIINSAARIPPFENNDKEKGFRDAMILETFAQIVADSPNDIKKCKIILLTKDVLLTKACNSRFPKPNNIKIMDDIEKCEEFISLLINDVTEEYIRQVGDRIGQCFYNQHSKSGIYYDYEIKNNIDKQFTKDLNQLYPSSTTRENTGGISIFNPVFSHKEGQKFFWTTKIQIKGACYRKEFVKDIEDSRGLSHYLNSPLNSMRSSSSPLNALEDNDYNGILSGYKTSLIGDNYLSRINTFSEKPLVEQKIRVANCSSIFEVSWSIVIKTNNTLGTSQVSGLQFIENMWEEV